jgi:hypothetical protein
MTKSAASIQLGLEFASFTGLADSMVGTTSFIQLVMPP